MHQQFIGEEVLHRRLSEKEIRKLSNEFHGLKITQEVQIDRYGADSEVQYRIKGITSSSASILNFEGTGFSRINVAQHYANRVYALRYPHMPCLQVKQ